MHVESKTAYHIEHTVINGGTVSSDLIKINASDANELSSVEVYLDGALIEKQDLKSGFSQIVVNKLGQYRIVAKDTLGNTSEFTFTNGMPDYFDYFVDGAEKEPELHSHLNFETVNGKKVYSKIDFGNKDFKLNIKKEHEDFSVGELIAKNFKISSRMLTKLKNNEKTFNNSHHRIMLVFLLQG